MTTPPSRRAFLGSLPAAGLAGSLAWPSGMVRGAADPPLVEPVRYRAEVEPLVAWVEETARERVVAEAAARVAAGRLSLRDLTAAVFLAAIRQIKPRPVGFKFHAVMAVHSAVLLGQTATAPADRDLPLFWALDNFKASQEQDRAEGDWVLGSVDEARLPASGQAARTFDEAMDAWDADKADAATAVLCRSAGASAVMERFFRYAIRDARNIGHKPIFAMQVWRTLQAIGWEHAEPVLRSLAFGLLDQQGEDTNAPSGPFQASVASAARLRPDWSAGKPDRGATVGLLDTFRTATPEEAGAAVVSAINGGVAAGSAWDAILLAGSELFLRAPGIIALHSVTAANALHFIHRAAGDEETRRVALVQAASWLPLYRARIQADDDRRIDAPAVAVPVPAEGILGDRKTNLRHAQEVVTALGATDAVVDLLDAARVLIVRKGRDSHQYKYGAAVWEESRLLTDPGWRGALVAPALAYYPASDAPDTDVTRTVLDANQRT